MKERVCGRQYIAEALKKNLTPLENASFHKETYADKMGECAQRHEEMPYHVVILEFPDINHGADRILNAAAQDQPEQEWMGLADKQWHKNEDRPAHDQINDQRNPRHRLEGNGFVEDAKKDHHPLQGENHDGLPSPDHGKSDWRISSCNCHIYKNVIQNMHDGFMLRIGWHNMIKSGHKEHEKNRKAKNGYPDHIGDRPSLKSQDRRQGNGKKDKQRRNAMGSSIGQFFTEGESACGK